MCGDVLKEDVVVHLSMVQLMVEGKEEKVMAVIWVIDGIDCCRVGFLPCHMVPRLALYNGALVQVTRVFYRNLDECHNTKCCVYHKNTGYAHAVITSDFCWLLALDYLGKT